MMVSQTRGREAKLRREGRPEDRPRGKAKRGEGSQEEGRR